MPNAPATGGFFTLHNGNLEADKLTAARSDAAERVEIHETRIEDGISKMRHLPEGVTIAAGQQVAFAPGGLHLMLMAPTRSLAVGEKVELTLTFANAPEQTVIFEVRDATAMPANHLGDHGAEGVDSHAH